MDSLPCPSKMLPDARLRLRTARLSRAIALMYERRTHSPPFVRLFNKVDQCFFRGRVNGAAPCFSTEPPVDVILNPQFGEAQ
jgi:hypothetical protein